MNIKKILNNDLIMLGFSIIFGSFLIFFADALYKNLHMQSSDNKENGSEQIEEKSSLKFVSTKV